MPGPPLLGAQLWQPPSEGLAGGGLTPLNALHVHTKEDSPPPTFSAKTDRHPKRRSTRSRGPNLRSRRRRDVTLDVFLPPGASLFRNLIPTSHQSVKLIPPPPPPLLSCLSPPMAKRPMPSPAIDESYFRRNYLGDGRRGGGGPRRTGGGRTEGRRLRVAADGRAVGGGRRRRGGYEERQMVELEKQRMQFAKDLEVQRMRLFMDTQVQLEKLKQAKRPGSSGASRGEENFDGVNKPKGLVIGLIDGESYKPKSVKCEMPD
ncbi:hypothetical protein PHJA_001315200 [Phtheirospermum japonicum]|uniref:Uncharacterized protein n=1 Tax=Phtheirospermum japonicum TaxID=374723 RepID=A0A830C0M9_9LAMI|nr:hypothetical protein PHJA_001315200 [Phtheirospermum japonicum]